MKITLTINDADHIIDADPATPLLYALRNDIKLNGAKYGCGLGQCGACMVHLDGEPVFSCITPVAALTGRHVLTIEGLGTATAPSVLQKAFAEEQAAQCGYCISGMIMRAQALLEHNPTPSDTQIRAYMQTNLCRCGTHMRIVRAIKRAAAVWGTQAAGAVPPL